MGRVGVAAWGAERADGGSRAGLLGGGWCGRVVAGWNGGGLESCPSRRPSPRRFMFPGPSSDPHERSEKGCHASAAAGRRPTGAGTDGGGASRRHTTA
jgi:hypothetical protein